MAGKELQLALDRSAISTFETLGSTKIISTISYESFALSVNTSINIIRYWSLTLYRESITVKIHMLWIPRKFSPVKVSPFAIFLIEIMRSSRSACKLLE